MIVDGSNEFVGSDLGKANQIIQLESAMKKADLTGLVQGSSVRIAVNGLAAHESATIYVATVEDQLTSNVTGGENQGSKLEHTSVVRELKAAGTISKDAQKSEVESSLNTEADWKKENLRYIAFVQENDSKKILAAARVVN
jgi:hypothetical protein